MKKMLLSAMSVFISLIAANAQEPVLSEGFEGGDVPPAGWTVRSCSDATTNRYKWEQVAYGSDPLKYRSGYTQGGTKAMMVSSGKTTSTKPAPDSWLITPQLTVSEGDYLSFMLAYAPVYNDNAVVPADKRIKFAVLVSTTGTDAADFTETLMEFAPYGETDWRKKVLSLQKYTGKNVYIAFREYGDCTLGAITLNRTWIDDVTVGKTAGADLVVSDLLSPVAGPKATQSVSIKYTNSGLLTSGLTASYSVNGGDPVSEQIGASVTCATGDTLSYTFAAPATLDAGAANIIKAWVTAGSDLVHENDTLAATVAIDHIFALPYEMNSDNLSEGWSYTYHSGKLNRGTNTGWWQIPDETATKAVWSYKLCAKESILEGRWFSLDAGKKNLTFNYTSGTDVPLTLILTDSETATTTETTVTLPANATAAESKVSVSIPVTGLYKLGIKCGAEYAGPFTINSLAISNAVPEDVAVASVQLPSAMVADSLYSVKVKLTNFGEQASRNFPVAVAVDDNVVLTDAIPSIEAGKTIDWTMGEGTAYDMLKGVSLAAGTHTIRVYTALADDSALTNDTISLKVYAYDKPSVPFAESFENSDDNSRWIADNLSDNALNWNIGSAISNGVNWAKGDGSNAAYMSSVAGAEHNAVLRSPVISVAKAGKVRLSYYYTTRMKATDPESKTFLEAALVSLSGDYTVSRKDTITDENIGTYRQGYILADIPAAGDYQILFTNTGQGHDVVLDDIRLDQQLDLAITQATQTAASGYNNTVNTVSVKVANHGAVAKQGLNLKLTTTVGSASSETPASYTGTIEPGDTITYTFNSVDISAAATYSFMVEVVSDDDADNFNNSWILPDIISYPNAIVPYVADFDTDEQKEQWTFGGTWQTGTYKSSNAAYNGTGAISHHQKAADANGDWAFSGCIEIPAGTYDLSFFYRTFLHGKTSDLYAQNFSLCLGSEPKAEAMTQTLYTSPADALAYEKRYKKVAEKITVAESGKYYLGVKCTSQSAYGVLYLDDIRISTEAAEPQELTSYDADFSTWYHYDPSEQFSQWTEAAGAISASQNIFNAGNPQTELPGILVSPAFSIAKDATVTATLDYSMAIADASVSDEEKSKMKTALYVATTDSPESFTTELASGTDLSGNSKTATGTFVCPASGVYYFGIGLAGAENCLVDQTTLTYTIYSLTLSAETSGISTVQTLSGSVELYTANGMRIGSFASAAEAMKHCEGRGVYILRQPSSSTSVKVVR